MFEQRAEHIGHLPAQILLDLARNEAATREWRKAAVELLIDKGFPQANHPDLTGLVMEIRAERAAKQEVEAVVETAIEEEVAPFDDSNDNELHVAISADGAVRTLNIVTGEKTQNGVVVSEFTEIPTHRLDPDVLPPTDMILKLAESQGEGQQASGPFKASVTADTLGRDDVTEN